jgi:3-oxoacyl-[acyl-carrier protein] reductase
MTRDHNPRHPLKVALVTGAASGIGAAVCCRLARDGYAIAAADTDEDGLSRTAASLGDHASVMTAMLDVRDADVQRLFVERVEHELGPIHAVVPCAGLTRPGPAETMSLADWQLILDVNLTGTFVTCQQTAKYMLRRGSGAVVCMASITAKGGQAGRASYAASKWAIAGLVKTLAIEWGARGIRVNAVCPGIVSTPLVVKAVPQEYQRIMRDRIPLRRFATTEEVGAAVSMLLSEDAAYINGSLLEVDGGITAGYLTVDSGEYLGSTSIAERITPHAR